MFGSYDLVAAAYDGDRVAAERLVSESLPLVYTLLVRAASPRADVPELVARTMALVSAGMPGLGEPAVYRPWLCGTALRFLWAAEQDDAAGRHADAPASLLGANTGAGTDQRAEAGEAIRWIGPDDRELLSLWWLEVAGELTRDELVAASGLSPAQAAGRIRQIEARYEDARTAVRVLASVPACADLTAVLARWDRRPSERRRRQVARHAEECPTCQVRTGDLIPADRLLRGTPLVPPPPAVTARVREVLASGAAAGLAPDRGRNTPLRRALDGIRRVAAMPRVQTGTRIAAVGVALALLIGALMSYAHSREADGDPSGSALHVVPATW
ncbi:hypothetical protein [Cryptosporangium phraense]|uniref:Sigma-70 family RNA polymerase sigma factor n=1 Tax=Cryptosporangium phraense TaxID=2593070 RepID=A0A545AIG8_9ACTN|nr:hypothetical protein [Cryptosporangium phraense]TQS41112.1 hypothetical protein FL583_31645 [Cryptosporangium phraense]